MFVEPKFCVAIPKKARKVNPPDCRLKKFVYSERDLPVALHAIITKNEMGDFYMKRKILLILSICVLILACLLTAAYFGIRSSFSAYRENGAHLRASAFGEEYNPVEQPLENGFMTTVDKSNTAS